MNNSTNQDAYKLLFEDIINDVTIISEEVVRNNSDELNECYKDTFALKELQSYKIL